MSSANYPRRSSHGQSVVSSWSGLISMAYLSVRVSEKINPTIGVVAGTVE